MKDFPAPVVLFAYNRPHLLRRTLDALQKNEMAAETLLIACSDGPKDATDAMAVAEVRGILDDTEGFLGVERHDAGHNLGLAESIIRGVSDAILRFGRVIVLEDDLLPGRFFLRYMNDALKRYGNDPRVLSIHAYFPAGPGGLDKTFFLRGANCWGWATWARAWSLFEPDGRKLLQKLDRSGERKRFDYNGAYPYRAMLKSQIRGDTESWAIRWYATTFLAGGLTLNPAHSLVVHTGIQGTHYSSEKSTLIKELPEPWNEQIPVEEIPVCCSREAVSALENWYRKQTFLPPLRKFTHAFWDLLRSLTPRPVLRVYREWKKKRRKRRGGS